MDELLRKEIENMNTLSEEEMKNMDFYSLALYLEELNKIQEVADFFIGGEKND